MTQQPDPGRPSHVDWDVQACQAVRDAVGDDEDTCQYYERGLLAPGVDYDTAQPYLEEICDPLDSDGYVTVPQDPGMGYKIRWDYIDEHRIVE